MRCTTEERRRSDWRSAQPTHWTRGSEKQPARGHRKRPGRHAKRPTRPRSRTAFRRCLCRHGPAGGDRGAGQRVSAGSGACFGPPRAFPVAGADGEGPKPSAHRQNAHPMRSRCDLIGPPQRRRSTFSAVTVGRPGEGPEKLLGVSHQAAIYRFYINFIGPGMHFFHDKRSFLASVQSLM